MARTKKTPTDPPADMELLNGAEAEPGSLSDLELASTSSLDPDDNAPQHTGTETPSDDTNPEACLHTGSEDTEAGPSQDAPAGFSEESPHTDPAPSVSGGEVTQSEPGQPEFSADPPHTGPEPQEGESSAGHPQHTDPAAADTASDAMEPDPLQPKLRSKPAFFSTEFLHTGSDLAPEEDTARIMESIMSGENDPASVAGVTDAQEPEAESTQQPQTAAGDRRRSNRVVSIDARRTVQTDRDKRQNDLLDVMESFKSKKILSGTIQGVERRGTDPDGIKAIIYHGDIKVTIPVLEAIEEPEDYRNQPKGDVLFYLLNKRMGAEVDYVVTYVDTIRAEGSRLQAMAMKRREYYFRTDRDGNYQIYEGVRAEARVVSVIRAGIFVDLFGAECYIPLRELSYQRWVDASAYFQPGQRVLVKVLEVDRSDRAKVQVSASVKQAGENPYEKALKKYTVGNRYVGTVSMVDLNGVFVSLDGGIDCLCTYPKRGRPPRGARATVRILGINSETNRIWGVITHMSTTR